jgi:hypothetical protein
LVGCQKFPQKAIELHYENHSAWLPLSRIKVKILDIVSVHDFEVFGMCEHCEEDKQCMVYRDEMICIDCFENNYVKPVENRVRSVIVVDDETVHQIASELIPALEHYQKIRQWENNRLRKKYGDEFSFEVLMDRSTEYISAMEIAKAKIKIINVMGGLPLMEDVYYALNQKGNSLASLFSVLADGIGNWAH